MKRGIAHEAVSSEITSPEPLDGEFQKSDGGEGLSPLSSQYSSCGESEFDRYCSANSVMGTPSVCSSMGMYHDSLDSEFGSLKSLEGFSLDGGRVHMRSEERTHSMSSREPGFVSNPDNAFLELKDEREGLSSMSVFEGKMEGIDNAGSSSLGHGVMPMLGSKADLKGVKVFDGEVGKKEDLGVLLKNVENVLLQGAVAARSAAENLFDCNHADEIEDERCVEQDETSSRYEHSCGEDSMFNYGSDDGSQPDVYYVRNVEDCHDENVGSGNLVLMNPSVAFGSKDWEDFELDGAENTSGMKLPDNLWERQQPSGENETNFTDFPLLRSMSSGNFQWHEEERNGRDVTVGSGDLRGVDKSSELPLNCSIANVNSLTTSVTRKQIPNNDGSDEYLENCSVSNIFEKLYPSVHIQVQMGTLTDEKERENQDITSDEVSGRDSSVSQQHFDTLPDIGVGEASFPSKDVQSYLNLDALESIGVESSEGYVSNSVSSWLDSDTGRIHDDLNVCEDEITTRKGKDFETNAFYDEVVHEMEEILLDSCNSPVTRSKQKNKVIHSEQLSPLRDGGSTASTSGIDDGYSLIRHDLRIDGIEVVGAKQRQGDVSLSERLVGVREYTVYTIQVWSGEDQWEVERRYRDFYALYHQLKTYFAAQECSLPPPWSSVEKESRKFFGNSSPDVIAERSTLIQECLSSIIQSRHSSSPPSALIWFLSPPEAILSSYQSNAVVQQSNIGAQTERSSSLGKTISLIVDIRSQKSMKELLDTQHYACAGCHTLFDNGKTRMQEIVQSFGWGKPRLCEYTGQLFCSSCHTNETAVLPARVLHHWDFTPYPVSQMAKSYLDSIIDKPMLCVSAANPFLFSRIPTLLHVVGVRRKIGAMLPYIHCSFRRNIYRRLGYRKYLLETNDFFALRDLVDLSKGAFAALPAILEAVLKKIQEHITELCLECCDNGVPCSARQACDNPSSLIFPFQEEEVQRCKSCNSVFHKHCFNKLAECRCGAILKPVNVNQSTTKLTLGNTGGEVRSLSFLGKKLDSKSTSGFLSSLFTTKRQGKMKGHKESDNVILMGSLPNTSL